MTLLSTLIRSKSMIPYCSGVISGIIVVTIFNLIIWKEPKQCDLNILRNRHLTSLSQENSDYPLVTNSNNYARINLLCIISTHPANFRLKVMNIVNTWAKRCDNVVFTTPSYSDKPEDKGFWENVIKDPKIKVLEVNGTSSRKDLWVRLKDGFIKTWKIYQNFDFVMKCDDDTHVVVDNLKYRLQSMDSSAKSLLGHVLHSQDTVFMSGGSGMVISNAGFKEIVENGFLSKEKPCDFPVVNKQQINVQADDDLQIGGCAKLLNFTFYSSEEDGKITFFPFKLESHLIPELVESWWRDTRVECNDMAVQDCPGQYPVSFHYVEPVQQYWLEYLLHTARVHKVQESKDLEVQNSLFDDGESTSTEPPLIKYNSVPYTDRGSFFPNSKFCNPLITEDDFEDNFEPPPNAANMDEFPPLEPATTSDTATADVLEAEDENAAAPAEPTSTPAPAAASNVAAAPAPATAAARPVAKEPEADSARLQPLPQLKSLPARTAKKTNDIVPTG